MRKKEKKKLAKRELTELIVRLSKSLKMVKFIVEILDDMSHLTVASKPFFQLYQVYTNLSVINHWKSYETHF